MQQIEDYSALIKMIVQWVIWYSLYILVYELRWYLGWSKVEWFSVAGTIKAKKN